MRHVGIVRAKLLEATMPEFGAKVREVLDSEA